MKPNKFDLSSAKEQIGKERHCLITDDAINAIQSGLKQPLCKNIEKNNNEYRVWVSEFMKRKNKLRRSVRRIEKTKKLDGTA